VGFDSDRSRLYNTLMQDQQAENQSTASSPEPQQPKTSWEFHNNAEETSPATANPTVKSVEWSASEFIAHAKSSGWYLLLALSTTLLAVLAYFLNRDYFSSIMIILIAIIFGVLAGRKPRELAYAVDDKGIKVGEKSYQYKDFRSFAIIQEDGIESIWFMPLKRFAPILSIYFEPQDGKKIVDILSRALPVENHKLDPIDRLMHKVRF
jgi:hypothetical protein